MRVGATAMRASSVCLCVSAYVRVDARVHVRVSERERERDEKGNNRRWNAVAPCQRMLQSPSNNNRSGEETSLLDIKKT